MILSSILSLATIIGCLTLLIWWIALVRYIVNFVRAYWFLSGWPSEGAPIKIKIKSAHELAVYVREVTIRSKDGNKVKTWRK